MEIVAIILFIAVFIFILFGFPVAFTLAGLSTLVGLIFLGPEFFQFLPSRFWGVMSNYVLMAVPLFIFMGMMLEKSGLAERLLETMARLFGKIRGGLAVSVVVVGALLAASTGIVGATVVTMGLISLPTMLKRNYDIPLATGTIASSGTLGQIIPPSIVLILLGSVMNISVGDLFAAAVLPGFGLVSCYIIYIMIRAFFDPDSAPSITEQFEEKKMGRVFWWDVFQAFLLPMLLIVAVLGSIFAGLASPTEAAAVGALGATALTAIQGELNFNVIEDVVKGTTHLTSMVFMILLGATTFALVFRGLGGDQLLIDWIEYYELSPYAFLAVVLIVVFFLGFFIDFIEIIFIVVPVIMPIFNSFDMDLLWIGILLAINLQTSFLTPPFGFALFYLKGVAPPDVETRHLYQGIWPFLLIQLAFLGILVLYPDFIYLLFPDIK